MRVWDLDPTQFFGTWLPPELLHASKVPLRLEPALNRFPWSLHRGATVKLGVVKRLLVFAIAWPLLVWATPAEESRERSLAERREMLANLERAQPGASLQLRRSAGYATFRAVGAGEKGRRKGVATVRQTMQDVFLHFEEVPVEANAGPPPRDVVFVFATRDDLSRFGMTGSTYGGHIDRAVDAPAVASPFPGAVAITPGVWAYILDGRSLVKDGRIAAAVYRIDNAAH